MSDPLAEAPFLPKLEVLGVAGARRPGHTPAATSLPAAACTDQSLPTLTWGTRVYHDGHHVALKEVHAISACREGRRRRPVASSDTSSRSSHDPISPAAASDSA